MFKNNYGNGLDPERVDVQHEKAAHMRAASPIL
jgi:hypothetical protein